MVQGKARRTNWGQNMWVRNVKMIVKIAGAGAVWQFLRQGMHNPISVLSL